MHTPPPACSSPDLTGQGERGLRGSAGLSVAPCCDQAPYPVKTQWPPPSPCPKAGGGSDLEPNATTILPPPPDWSVRTSYLALRLLFPSGRSPPPRVVIRHSRGFWFSPPEGWESVLPPPYIHLARVAPTLAWVGVAVYRGGPTCRSGRHPGPFPRRGAPLPHPECPGHSHPRHPGARRDPQRHGHLSLSGTIP